MLSLYPAHKWILFFANDAGRRRPGKQLNHLHQWNVPLVTGHCCAL